MAEGWVYVARAELNLFRVSPVVFSSSHYLEYVAIHGEGNECPAHRSPSHTECPLATHTAHSPTACLC